MLPCCIRGNRGKKSFEKNSSKFSNNEMIDLRDNKNTQSNKVLMNVKVPFEKNKDFQIQRGEMPLQNDFKIFFPDFYQVDLM